MPFVTKQTAVRLLARYPIYRALPPGGLRACGALLYHAEHSPPERVTRLAETFDGIPTRRLSVAMPAARAAFRAGQDNLLEPALAELEQRFPEASQPLLLRADLLTYQGQFEAALQAAHQAQLLYPASVQATARVVTLTYRALGANAGDEVAVNAISRLPRASEALWAICKACDTAEQFGRLYSTWQSQLRGPADLLYAVRPLASAASRAGLVDEAVGLYRQAIKMIANGTAEPRKFTETQLGGRGAWQAILDLNETMNAHQIPFFFAAGTALGLVREGRPLSADSDIDIGVFDQDWDRQAIIKIFIDHPRFDLELHPQTLRVSLRHRGGSPIDIFRFYPEGSHVYHDGVFVRWQNTPFKIQSRQVQDRTLPLPDNAEEYLTENYGDWRVPNPAFDAFTEDAPNVTITWPDYQRLHFVRRAYKFLSTGDKAGAKRELERAGEVDSLNPDESEVTA